MAKSNTILWIKLVKDNNWKSKQPSSKNEREDEMVEEYFKVVFHSCSARLPIRRFSFDRWFVESDFADLTTAWFKPKLSTSHSPKVSTAWFKPKLWTGNSSKVSTTWFADQSAQSTTGLRSWSQMGNKSKNWKNIFPSSQRTLAYSAVLFQECNYIKGPSLNKPLSNILKFLGNDHLIKFHFTFSVDRNFLLN